MGVDQRGRDGPDGMTADAGRLAEVDGRPGRASDAAPRPHAARDITMMAMVQDRYGAGEVLQPRDIDRSAICADNVLVRVRAAGVNPADWAIMRGLPYIARLVYGLRKPKIRVRGTDMAGTVEAVGAGVRRFRPGDEVFGWSDGSLAEYAAPAEDALVLKPDNVTVEQAAAVPMAGLVALQAIRDHGGVSAGHNVLINGASGGIGIFAVQIAKSFGAHVTGVCSTRNMDMVRSIGADEVIDYTAVNFTRGRQRYDVILDNVANHTLSDLRRVLTPDGTLVPNGGGFDNHWIASGGRVLKAHLLNRFVGHRLRPFLVSFNHDDLVTLAELIDAGTLMPVIDRVYRLSDAAQAIDYVGEGHARGKVVVSV
jgi:NADPH:quinone reductase-like Zn-dependent oxidoreductase